MKRGTVWILVAIIEGIVGGVSLYQGHLFSSGFLLASALGSFCISSAELNDEMMADANRRGIHYFNGKVFELK